MIGQGQIPEMSKIALPRCRALHVTVPRAAADENSINFSRYAKFRFSTGKGHA